MKRANRFCWIGDFNDELGIALLPQIDGDGFRGIADIPENPIALLEKSARGDDAGDMRPERPKTSHRIVSGSNADDVFEWKFQTTLHAPELVPALDFDRELAF